MSLTDLFYYVTPVVATVTLIFSFYEIRKNRKQIKAERQEINHRMYETLILREIGERIGYELNIEHILETVISSLTKLVPYSVASYLLLAPDPEKVLYRAHLDESVGHSFLSQVRDYLLKILNETFKKDYVTSALQERISGTIIDDTDSKRVASLWLAPLKINDRGVGVIALASTKRGMFLGPEMKVLEKILDQANRAVNQLEDVISSEQSKIYSMISSMPDGVMMLDKSNTLVAINETAKKMLGLEGKIEVSILDIVSSLSDKIDLRAKIEESAKTNNLVKVDNLVIGNNVVRVYITPAFKKEKFIGSVVVFHDTSAQKELERLREDFTAMMVHELRAPLTLIRGTTDMFLNQPALAAGQQGKELLDSMKNSSGTMLNLVNDLLDAAKIEAGKFQINKSDADLDQLAKLSIGSFMQLAQTKQISLSLESPATPMNTQLDKDRIGQVFNNLISNAIKFTSPGGKITVALKTLNSPSDLQFRFGQQEQYKNAVAAIAYPCLLVSVHDTGMGIPPQQIKDLFFKFKQLERNTATHKGTGLGLVIAKGIIESHGGTIFVESEVTTGTTFHFTLPMTKGSPNS